MSVECVRMVRSLLSLKENTRDNFKGSRGPFKGPRGPSTGPRGLLKGPRGTGGWCGGALVAHVRGGWGRAGFVGAHVAGG